MQNLDSTYAKPFLSIPAQIQRLRSRGMDCGSDDLAAATLERYGYYRLSGYWHPYRRFQPAPIPALNNEDRENRLDTFRAGTDLAQVVAIYEFDQELRNRLSALLSQVEISLRFFIGHRLGTTDPFAHRKPEVLGARRLARRCDEMESMGREDQGIRRRPACGRASVIVLIVGWVCTFLGMAQNTVVLQSVGKAAFWVSLLLSLGLAICSLVKRERRGWAITALCLIVAIPAIAFIVGLLVLAIYAAAL